MCTRNSCTCSKGNSCPVAYPTFPGSLTGNNGWSPQLAVVVDAVNLDADGNDRDILQLTGWFGGTGTTPTDYVGQYLGTTGFVPLIINGINIRGQAGATGTGFNDDPWDEITDASMTVGNSVPPTETVDGDTGVGTFTLTALTTSRIRSKQLGRTMILQYNISGTAIISGGVPETISIRFFIKIPNSKIANSVYDSGSAFLVPSGSSIANAVYPNTSLVYSTDPTYIVTQFFPLQNNSGGVTCNWFLNGSIIFETTT